MADAWSKPYQVVVEVENKECKMLKKFAALGLLNLKVVDLRISSKGSVKHLVELDLDQSNMCPPNSVAQERKSRSTEGDRQCGLKARVAKSATQSWPTTRFW